ncbi:hypothetical protein LCGC14_0435190 [marine sediment metagenome]|uniref:Uncharacterized protein n=1 Tax=marine sediment metagenome TaxID=412755 RepID=A0A0F9T570_9ZZZZ
MKIIIIIALCLSLNGCVWFLANNKGAFGLGKYTEEYYADGTLKKKSMESKSILDGIFGFKINTKTGD